MDTHDTSSITNHVHVSNHDPPTTPPLRCHTFEASLNRSPVYSPLTASEPYKNQQKHYGNFSRDRNDPLHFFCATTSCTDSSATTARPRTSAKLAALYEHASTNTAP